MTYFVCVKLKIYLIHCLKNVGHSIYKNKTPFQSIFQGFCLFVKETHFQKHLAGRFPVLYPKILVQVNSSALIFQNETSTFDVNSLNGCIAKQFL